MIEVIAGVSIIGGAASVAAVLWGQRMAKRQLPLFEMKGAARTLDARSEARLVGVHPDLVRVVRRAAEMSSIPFFVVEGVRSPEQAYVNWGKGRTEAELRAAGVPVRFAQPGEGKVTWLAHPLGSKHLAQKDGYGHAVDLLNSRANWAWTESFYAVAKAMMGAAAIERVNIRWGADWNRNGKPYEPGEKDSPHFELI